MKAITLWQPWASAVALQQKRFETRSWPTKYRGPLAIHASSRINSEDNATFTRNLLCLHQIDLDVWNEYCECEYKFLPFGEVVATCDLIDCFRIEKARPGTTEELWGDYSPGRFAWKLQNIQRLTTPIPATGRQGLWEWQTTLASKENLQLSLL